MTDYSPIIRIFLRYTIPTLVSYGVLTQETAGLLLADADLEYMLAGALSAIVTELWYRHARKSGGAT